MIDHSIFSANLPGRVAWVMDELKSQDNTSTSTRRPPPRVMQCPATVSVIGALASQESIKACSHIHTPLNQMLLFESLDSLLPSSYNDEVRS
jgi:hypothetical protein